PARRRPGERDPGRARRPRGRCVACRTRPRARRRGRRSCSTRRAPIAVGRARDAVALHRPLRSAGTVTAPGRASRNALLPPGTFHTVRSPFTPPFLERSHDGKPNRVPTTGEACRVATPGPPTGPDGAGCAGGDDVAGDGIPRRARR